MHRGTDRLESLNSLFETAGEIDIGQFQFINLKAVKRRAGDDWKDLQEKIFQTGLFFIEKRAAPDDLIIRCRDGFIIVFADLAGEEATARCRQISRQMTEFFLGDEAYRDITISAGHVVVDAPALKALVAASGGMAEGAPDDGARAAGKPPAAALWERVVYRPLWDSRAAALVGHMCCAQGEEDGFGRRGEGFALLSENSGPADAAKLNMALAESAVTALTDAARNEAAFIIVLPVHYNAFEEAHHRQALLALISEIPDHLKRYLFISLERLHDGAPLSHVYESVQVLRPHANLVSLSGRTANFQWESYDDCRAGGFHVDLNQLPAALSARKISLAHVANAARRARVKTLASNISTAQSFNVLTDLGFRYLAGNFIAPVSNRPAPPARLSAEAILAQNNAPAALVK